MEIHESQPAVQAKALKPSLPGIDDSYKKVLVRDTKQMKRGIPFFSRKDSFSSVGYETSELQKKIDVHAFDSAANQVPSVRSIFLTTDRGVYELQQVTEMNRVKNNQGIETTQVAYHWVLDTGAEDAYQVSQATPLEIGKGIQLKQGNKTLAMGNLQTVTVLETPLHSLGKLTHVLPKKNQTLTRAEKIVSEFVHGEYVIDAQNRSEEVFVPTPISTVSEEFTEQIEKHKAILGHKTRIRGSVELGADTGVQKPLTSTERLLKSILSRRKFVRRATGTTLSLLTLEGTFSLAKTYLDAQTEQMQLPEVNGPVMIGNLALSYLITDHTQQDWDEKEYFLKQAFDQFPIVIPEYAPMEYTDLEQQNNPVSSAVHTYDSTNALYNNTQDYLKQTSGKQLWVVDPAHSSSFIALRELLNLPKDAIQIPIMLAAWKYLEKKSQADLAPREQPTPQTALRNRVINTLAKIAAVAATAIDISPDSIVAANVSEGTGGVDVDISMLVEKDFREVQVADRLVRLGKLLPKGSKALLLYPGPHTKNILHYVQNPLALQERLQLYGPVKEFPSFSDLYTMRNYKTNGERWERIQIIQAT